MVTIKTYRTLALSFPEVIELPHFDRASFRVHKKIFTTLLEKDKLVMVRLSPVDQRAFCDLCKNAIYPVPGTWGKQGATYIRLKNVSLAVLKDALAMAYVLTAPAKLSAGIRHRQELQ
jgi:hypothetical protein